MTDNLNPYAPPQVEQTLADGPPKEAIPPLRRVGTGLTLVFYGILLLSLALIASAVAGYVVVPLFLVSSAVVSNLITLVAISGAALLIIGPLFCLDVPSRTRAKGPLIVAIVLQLVSIPLRIPEFSIIAQYPQLSGLPLLFNFIAGIFFAVFMRQLALHLEQENLAHKATLVRMCFNALSVVFLLGPFAAQRIPDSLMLATSLGLLTTVIILLLFYASLVNDLRKILRG